MSRLGKHHHVAHALKSSNKNHREIHVARPSYHQEAEIGFLHRRALIKHRINQQLIGTAATLAWLRNVLRILLNEPVIMSTPIAGRARLPEPAPCP